MSQVLLILLTYITGYTQPYTVAEFSAAIVAIGHGSELWWYTPEVRYRLPEGAPSGVKGATSCWPPQFSGVVYINPSLPEGEVALVVMHELVHLHTNCQGYEHGVELAALDVLAYLGRKQDVLRGVVEKIDGCYNPVSLAPDIVEEYYCKPARMLLYGEISKEYPYLYKALEDIGVREREYEGKQ